MDSKLWTQEEIQETVAELSEDYCFITGSPLGPIDFYYRSPYGKEGLDTIQACVEPTIGYDISAFNENVIETLPKAKYPFWTMIAVPRDALSEDALNQL